MSAVKKYNVVLVGCGHMGRAHLDLISALKNVNLFAVVDVDEGKAKHFKERYHAGRYYTDYRDAVAEKAVDIVIICTYPSTHLEILKECVKNQKHVLCEKPITPTIEEAGEFINLMETADVKILCGYILRHNKSYQLIKTLIRKGEIGGPVLMRMTQNHQTVDWQRYRVLIEETSPIIDCGVHYVDVMEWVTGEKIQKVTAVGASTEPDIKKGDYNYGLLTASLSGGSLGYYEAGWGNTISAINEKEFIGPKGRIRLILQNDRADSRQDGDLVEVYQYPEGIYERHNVFCQRKPTDDQLSYLIRMIEENIPPVPTPQEVLRGMKTVLEADRKIRQQKIFKK